MIGMTRTLAINRYKIKHTSNIICDMGRRDLPDMFAEARGHTMSKDDWSADISS